MNALRVQFAHDKDEVTVAHGGKVEGADCPLQESSGVGFPRRTACSVIARRIFADKIFVP